MVDFNLLAAQYKSELLDRVMPFWMENSIDKEFGGYFTCIERNGEVYDTDKFIWLQGREVWMLATLYNKVEKKQEWLDAAIQGAEFLKKYGHDGQLNWYFSLDREGRPLVDRQEDFRHRACEAEQSQRPLEQGSSGRSCSQGLCPAHDSL